MHHSYGCSNYSLISWKSQQILHKRFSFFPQFTIFCCLFQSFGRSGCQTQERKAFLSVEKSSRIARQPRNYIVWLGACIRHGAPLYRFSLSKNLTHISNLHNMLFQAATERRLGEPPARVPHRKTSRRDVFRPSCALKCKGSASCGTRRGFCPSTPPPFKNGGRKLLCNFF